jgi:hypothetical protein
MKDRIASWPAGAITMLWAVIIWEHIRAIPGALEQITLEGLFDSVGEIFNDPESLLPFIVFLLLLWALIAAAKFWVGVITELFSRDSGPRGLGIN